MRSGGECGTTRAGCAAETRGEETRRPTCAFSLSHPPHHPTHSTLKTVLQGVALSAALGYAAALGVAWVGKSVATLLVAAAALLQYLHMKRIMRVNWASIGRRFTWMLDLDRDGKLGVGDVKVALRRVGGVLGVTRVPSGAAFIVGLAFGLGLLPPKL